MHNWRCFPQAVRLDDIDDVLLAIPCGLAAAISSAVLAARDRRRTGKDVNGGVIVAYSALVILGAGLLMLTVAAIAFYRTPLTF